MWYFFALLSACFSSLRKVGEKQLSHKLGFISFGWMVQLCSLPVILVALILFGELYNPLSLGPSFWIPTILMSSLAYPGFLYFYVYALRNGELSKVLPLQSLTPIFALIFGRLFIHQIPRPLAGVGILLVVMGVYILNLRGKYLHSPFKIFSNDKPNLYMLISVIISALVGVFDYIAIQQSDAIYYSFVSTILIVFTLLFISKLTRNSEMVEIKRNLKPLLFSGLISGVSYSLYALSLNDGPLAYVSALKSTSVLMGSALGIIYFKEQITSTKIIALILTALGTIVVGFGR